MSTFALAVAMLAIGGCLAIGISARPAVRTLRPAQAVVLLAVASFALSLACGIALTAIAVAVLATFTSVAAQGHWSAAAMRAQIALPGWLGAAAAMLVSVLLLRAAWRTATISVALVRAERLCRSIRLDGGPVVVVDDDSADAYTVAGIRGCVVLSRRLLTHLTADERRVVTAHELSHLTRRHHLYVHVADIAAAANPLLRAVPGAIRSGVERWADEDACVGIGDRRRTGQALARVALLRSSLTRAAGSRPRHTVARAIPVLGMAQHEVAVRVQALLQPAPRCRIGQVVLAVALSLLILLAGVTSLAHIQDAIESASWYRT